MLVFIFVIQLISVALFLGVFYVWYLVRHSRSPKNFKRKKVRTLVVMGSGGHTTEMVEVLKTLPPQFECIFVLADTDRISQGKVEEIVREKGDQALLIERIPRSREVGQSYITSIFSTLVASMHALRIVWNAKPDLLLTNGPGTCIPVCIAAFLFDLLRLRDTSIVFIESICRVKSLSLSGAILYFLGIADDLIVHWPDLKLKYPRVLVLSDISIASL